ncbi:hypothetical protein V2A60_002495 [Cordyceps javanica]|uniref:Protein kinase-like domain n=1 Tax=Cordyceps javanica TaxID=43265 RepID=A0A545UMX0_9HYPO|nr:Protein kinase-like domain [Cordyceps javanica]TQW02450.1 Protein kinase-like domain [Cordyceps javanica]
MSAASRWLQVLETWGECPQLDGAREKAWERKRLDLVAYDGYSAFIGSLSLSERGEWTAGIYRDLDEATFNSVLATMRGVPDAGIYPMFEQGLTEFDPDSMQEGEYFLKSPNVGAWNEDAAVANLFLSEARNHQLFLRNPHPQLGAYLGCVVHNGRIVRLAFPHYFESLYDRIQRAQLNGEERMEPGERSKCMHAIRKAVAHLHSLGYAHNDISASNIMFDKDGNAVLIDLDSCTPFGEKIGKGGIVGGWRGPRFWEQRFETSSVECDEASLQYIDDWLSGKQE